MSVYIIAEAGVNHNGSLERAKELVCIAKKSGCDCVKFQSFSADKIVTKKAKKAKYQIENTNNDDSQYKMLKKLELSKDDFFELKKHCDELKIDFLSTPFDEEAVDMLEDLEVDAYKISSGDITNKPLLQYIANKGRKILLSTGMSTLEEVKKAVEWIEEAGNKNIVLFHCTSNYPAPYDSVNMKAMLTLREKFGYPIGYSDHTAGIEISLMSVAYGASIVEKHFTYDKKADGPDHKASLSPKELEDMVKSIRHIEEAVGEGKKIPTETELSTREVARKSLVWKKTKIPGEIVTREDICCKRPGNGICPEKLDDIIGLKITKKCEEDNLVEMEDFEGILT